ncbi:hypothetical protein [Acaryochloris sp. CCMEE 5410]|uniref:hypothetical protein n=1 Tax=Acaryochloris sp. CCMEE 5410 TaxID=310037 RepID=UPI0021D0CC93|nr:hypothetical protein [Acaryochloris sp. CCMEE 5410]KAI9129900.1 hypothetical protein ON05_029975 [Acaryochloris sp. CCMEE 5410]
MLAKLRQTITYLMVMISRYHTVQEQLLIFSWDQPNLRCWDDDQGLYRLEELLFAYLAVKNSSPGSVNSTLKPIIVPP